MATDDDTLKAIQAQDQEWLLSHRAELWAVAQKGYAEEGRGALIVLFKEDVPGVTVVVYTTEPLFQEHGVVKHLARYNPATQMIVLCMGQIVANEVVPGPRAY